MRELNLPLARLKIIEKDNRGFVFDSIRKKYILLTEEEWVRQHFIHYLCNEKGFPASLIAVEKALKVNNLLKRADIVVYDKMGKPKIIVECKAPEIKIDQQVFDQAARYNMTLQVDYLIVTNGVEHYCCKINYNDHSYNFLEDIPNFNQIV